MDKVLEIVMAIAIIGLIICLIVYYANNKKKKRKNKNFDSEFEEAYKEWKKKNATKEQETKQPQREYIRKQSLLTKCEKEYYQAIRKELPICYILQPQVNLATIIEKVSDEKYQSELYRNIDFCVFNQEFEPLLLIEINDKTHELDKSRQARDQKVKEICEAAGIPLIRFWTKYGIDGEYIKKRLKENLK